MKLEEAIERVNQIKNYEYRKVEKGYRGHKIYAEAIETALQELERYKRLAEANLKDSEEFQNNLCEHRCILKSELQELQENSIPKKKIEKLIKDYKEARDNYNKNEDADWGEFNHYEWYQSFIKDLRELLEEIDE